MLSDRLRTPPLRCIRINIFDLAPCSSRQAPDTRTTHTLAGVLSSTWQRGRPRPCSPHGRQPVGALPARGRQRALPARGRQRPKRRDGVLSPATAPRGGDRQRMDHCAGTAHAGPNRGAISRRARARRCSGAGGLGHRTICSAAFARRRAGCGGKIGQDVTAHEPPTRSPQPGTDARPCGHGRARYHHGTGRHGTEPINGARHGSLTGRPVNSTGVRLIGGPANCTGIRKYHPNQCACGCRACIPRRRRPRLGGIQNPALWTTIVFGATR